MPTLACQGLLTTGRPFPLSKSWHILGKNLSILPSDRRVRDSITSEAAILRAFSIIGVQKTIFAFTSESLVDVPVLSQYTGSVVTHVYILFFASTNLTLTCDDLARLCSLDRRLFVFKWTEVMHNLSSLLRLNRRAVLNRGRANYLEAWRVWIKALERGRVLLKNRIRKIVLKSTHLIDVVRLNFLGRPRALEWGFGLRNLVYWTNISQVVEADKVCLILLSVILGYFNW